MFNQLPSNTTAIEGGSANFSCIVHSTMQLNSIWGVQVPGKQEINFGGPAGVNMSDFNGSRSTAFIGMPFDSHLTIANVTRSLDGTQVRCFFRNGILKPQEMPYAFLTVQCELFNVYTVHYSCCDIKQPTYLPTP